MIFALNTWKQCVGGKGRIKYLEGSVLNISVSIQMYAISAQAAARKVKVEYSTRYNQANRTRVHLARSFWENTMRDECSRQQEKYLVLLYPSALHSGPIWTLHLRLSQKM
jgi:hypothetical protein